MVFETCCDIVSDTGAGLYKVSQVLHHSTTWDSTVRKHIFDTFREKVRVFVFHRFQTPDFA